MRVRILVAMKVMPLLLRRNFFIPLGSIFIIMLMQITLIMCQAEIEGRGLVCTYVALNIWNDGFKTCHQQVESTGN